MTTSDVPMRKIEAGPLQLEPQICAHAEEMFEVLSDRAIYEFENEPPPSVEWLRLRFEKLESRQSGDGREKWLNWVIRLPTGELIGYVQASVRPDGSALIAYELASRYWGRGYGPTAVEAMIGELTERYEVTLLRAVAKRQNRRSFSLLRRLGFVPADAEMEAAAGIDSDEAMMIRSATAR